MMWTTVKHPLRRREIAPSRWLRKIKKTAIMMRPQEKYKQIESVYSSRRRIPSRSHELSVRIIETRNESRN